MTEERPPPPERVTEDDAAPPPRGGVILVLALTVWAVSAAMAWIAVRIVDAIIAIGLPA